MAISVWDEKVNLDAVEDNEYIVLEPGEYDFTVEGYEKMMTNSGSPMAVVSMSVKTDDGRAFIKDNIVLSGKADWKVKQFAQSVGTEKEDTYLKIFDKAVGKSGKAKFKVEEYNGKSYNKVERYLKADNKFAGIL